MENNYKPNSNKSKIMLTTEADKPKKERPTLNPVTQGKVDKGPLSGFVKNFTKAKNEIEKITPYVKNAMRIADIMVTATDNILYGHSAFKPRNNYYTKVSWQREPFWANDSLPWNNNDTTALSFGSVRVESRAAAKEVLNEVYRAIQEYKYASVAMLYQAADISIPLGETSYNRYGWSDISTAEIKPSLRGGYIIVMPKPMPLED